MNSEARKWLRPPEKIVDKDENRYESLDQFFIGNDAADDFMNFYDIENDQSWINDVFAVALVEGVREGKMFINQNFKEITLAGAKLQGAIITGSDFSFGNLVAVDFFGSDLEGVNFTACDLRKVDFRKCNLKNADFTEANLAGAVFDDADLTGVTFTDSYVMGAKLGNAKIDEKAKSEFDKMMQIIEDAQNGQIPLHHLPNSILRCLDWKRMHLSGVDLSKLDLTGISLVGVNLSGTFQRVMAVPPTYIEKEDKKITSDAAPINIVRPEEKPSIILQTVPQKFEFIEIFKDEKLQEDDKPEDIIIAKPIKKTKKETDEPVPEQVIEPNIHKNLEKMQKRFDAGRASVVVSDSKKEKKIQDTRKETENLPSGSIVEKEKSIEQIEKMKNRIDKKDGRTSKSSKGNIRT